ncbi:hypothetical protein ACOMHN_057644 [Nucella lapillus]
MTVRSVEQILNEIPEYRLLKALMLYVPPVLIVLGTLGNVFSFIILRRRAMVKVSSYHYLASLAVADSLVLYIGLLRLWLAEVTGTAFHDGSQWLCKVTVSLSYTASDLSVWLIIAVTVERYIVVCFPLKASRMITTARAKKVILALVALMLVLNLHFFWTVRVVERPLDGRAVGKCQAAPRHQHLVNEVWPWVDACIYSFLPFLAILVLNVLIIREVVQARQHRLRLQTPDHHYHGQMIRFRAGGATQPPRNELSTCRRVCGPGEGMKLTFMLLTVSFAFLLTTLPMNVSLIVTAFWQHQRHSLTHTVRFQLAKTVAELLMYLNHAINFALYCATGHKFRQQIVHLLRCRRDTYSAWTSLHNDDTRCSSSLRQDLATSNRGQVAVTHIPDLFMPDTDLVNQQLPAMTKV